MVRLRRNCCAAASATNASARARSPPDRQSDSGIVEGLEMEVGAASELAEVPEPGDELAFVAGDQRAARDQRVGQVGRRS